METVQLTSSLILQRVERDSSSGTSSSSSSRSTSSSCNSTNDNNDATAPSAATASFFLLGRWICQLQQCLKLVQERIQIFPRVVKKNLFFIPKVRENLRHVDELCQIILNSLSSDEDRSTAKEKEEVEAGFVLFEDNCWNRFCELTANYFRLRLYLASVVFGIGGGDSIFEEEEEEEDDNTVNFIRSEYRQMFPKRSDGRGRSIEALPLESPSLDWFKKGRGSIFRLLDISMSLLVKTVRISENGLSEEEEEEQEEEEQQSSYLLRAKKELDLFEIESLGMGATARLSRYAAAVGGIVEPEKEKEEEGSLNLNRPILKEEEEEEKEAAQFWRELAASLLANAIEIDRKALRSKLVAAAATAQCQIQNRNRNRNRNNQQAISSSILLAVPNFLAMEGVDSD
jgi:hypothetical protein